MKHLLLRLFAFYLDIIFVMIPFSIASVLSPADALYQLYSGISVLTYFVFCDYFFGRSIGKMIFKLKISGYEITKKKIYLKQIFIRNLFRIVPFDQISFFFNNDKRMWHDIVSKTSVVATKRQN